MFHNKNANFVNGVTINIKDKETIKTFYENVLGFNLINESETAVQFEVGDSNQFITFIEIQNGREPLMSEAGLFHIGILLPTLTTLADLLVHLSDFGVPVNGGQQSVATCLFIEDPEGNAIKFYVDRETESWIDEKEGRIRMDIAPINVPRLLQNISHTQWQGIPDETKLGSLHIKSIRISDVKSYYLNYFGLEESAYMDDYSLFLSSNEYYNHLAVNQWLSATKRVDNEHTYGLAMIDFHYPKTTHKNLKGPDGIYFRFNRIKEV